MHSSFLSAVKFLFAGIAVTILAFLVKNWLRRKKARAALPGLQPEIKEANTELDKLLNNQKYFSDPEEKRFLNRYSKLRKLIVRRFDKLGLDDIYVKEIRQFVSRFDRLIELRTKYNDAFVKQEAKDYAGLFNHLEDYPLSAEQVEAIVRDEHNNLVIAGAGTGKTTTIAGKVAYLLAKGLAKPEDLLIISFTKNAINEMKDRCHRFCRNVPDIQKLNIRTFNSFGYWVNRHSSENELHLAFNGDDEAAKMFFQEKFDDLFLTDKDFHKKAVNFLAFFERPERDEFNFNTKDEFERYEKNFKNSSLDGRKLKSREEVQIANFFCLQGIQYEYEKHYALQPEDRNADFGSYRPDFYLPEYQIWHEHLGIDRDGNVPSWFSASQQYASAKDTYHAGILWKESIHAKYKTTLIKTYSFENREGRLLANLKKRLLDHGVVFKQLKPEEILGLLKASPHYKEFIELIFTFLGLMKSNGKVPDSLSARILDKRFSVFLDVFKPLYYLYEERLVDRSELDFNDMINQSARYIENGQFKKSFKYVLIDEFQDTSMAKYTLLKSLRKQNPNMKLYAVGDDWQSIYRFTGSDISIITNFKRYFGATYQTSILNTYRFNTQIAAVSGKFIQRNPKQLRKEIKAQRPAESESFVFVAIHAQGDRALVQTKKEAKIRSVLDEILKLKEDARVFFIGRYHHNRPLNLLNLQASYPSLKMEYHTAHRVKGMTCDYAILLDVDSGEISFPAEMADDPILSALLDGDEFVNAEERRLFYVAITRAKHRNYILYDWRNPSKFVGELVEMNCGL